MSEKIHNNENLNEKLEKIQQMAVEILEKVIRKDYVLHTLTVTRAMEMLLEKEGGDPETMLAAALCHDLGWHDVPDEYQLPDLPKDMKQEAIRLHIFHNPPLTKKVLSKCDYSDERIDRIIKIIQAHRLVEPKDLDFEQKLLIDADTLSDVFADQLYSDAKSYNRTPREVLEFRKSNIYFTKTAQEIFAKEVKSREIEIGK